jgi:hypothetical protein
MPLVRWCNWQHTWFSASQQEFDTPTDCHAVVAQSKAERPVEAREATGSIPVSGTTSASCHARLDTG